MDDPAEAYAKRIDAVSTQRTRLHEEERQDDSWGGTTARRFRFDPDLQCVLLRPGHSYLRQEDG